MTSFVHVDQPLQHAGLNRATAAFDNIRNAGQGATRFGLAFRLLIAAGVVLLAVSTQLTTHEFDAGWMAAWISLCAIAFGVIALSANKIGPTASRIATAWRGMAQRRASALADERFLAHASYDPRVLMELQAAITRQQADGELPLVASAKVDAVVRAQQTRRTPTLHEVLANHKNLSRYY